MLKLIPLETVVGSLGKSISSMSVNTTKSANGFTKNRQFTWDSSIPKTES